MILLNNSIIYITLGILFQLLVEVKSQPATFTPDLRKNHAATFINDKLYILGGVIPNLDESPKRTFLYLDFSVSFNNNELKWYDLSSINIVPPNQYATAIKGGANNNTLFLYGGESLSGEKMPLVYTFDTQSNLWGNPNTTGIQPIGKLGTTPVIGYDGLIYLLDGYSNVPTLFVFDTMKLSWSEGSIINVSPRIFYGAVFLPNKNIIYMGGYNMNSETIPLDIVTLYDTLKDIWMTKATNGLIPPVGYGFSSCLGLDGQRVIIFGDLDNAKALRPPGESLFVLDLNNFNWYIPRVSGKIPSSRAFHEAVVIGKYMVIIFGQGYTQEKESDVLLLDISNNDQYIWTTNFEPSSPPAPSSPVSSLSKIVTAVNVGIIIESTIGVILLTIGSFFLYRWYKNRNERKIQTSTRKNYLQEILQIPRINTHQHAIDYF